MYTVEELNSDIARSVETECTDDFVKIRSADGTQHCIMPRKFVETALERIKNMEIYEDDLWIVSYAKCGTTWTQEMLWMINNNLDYEGSKAEDLFLRYPFLEWAAIIKNFETDYVEMCANLPRPRHIKSHLPLFLLPEKLWTVKPKVCKQ
jgi:hypothetical protein